MSGAKISLCCCLQNQTSNEAQKIAVCQDSCQDCNDAEAELGFLAYSLMINVPVWVL